MPKKLAVFVDLENVVGAFVRGERDPLSWIKEEGQVSIARAYGDLLNPSITAAVKPLQDLGFQMIQPIAGKPKKNAADMHLALDVLEVCLGSNPPDVVLLVSSDVDYVPLVHKLKERHIRVVGAGMAANSSKAAVEVYDRFVVIPHRRLAAKSPVTPTQAAVKAADKAVSSSKQTGMMQEAADAAKPREGANPAVGALVDALIVEHSTYPQQQGLTLATIGQRLKERHPKDLLKANGFKNLSALVKRAVELGLVKTSGSGMQMLVSLKSAGSATNPRSLMLADKAEAHTSSTLPADPMLDAQEEAARLDIKLPTEEARASFCHTVIGFFKGQGGLFIEPPSQQTLRRYVAEICEQSKEKDGDDASQDMLARLEIAGAVGTTADSSGIALLGPAKNGLHNALNSTYLLQIIEQNPGRQICPASAALWLFAEDSEVVRKRVAKSMKLAHKLHKSLKPS